MAKKSKAMNSFESLARRISREGHLQKNSKGYTARCPGAGHNNGDRNPSMFIGERDDRKGVTLSCFAGCSTDAILQGAGLELRNLYYENNRGKPGGDTISNGRKGGVTVKPSKNGRPPETYKTGAKASRAAVERMERRNGKSVKQSQYLYYTVDNEPFGVVVRCDFGDDDRKEFRQIHRRYDGLYEMTAGPNIWPLFRLEEINQTGTVYLHEGEKAAEAGWRCGLQSTTSKGGSKAATQTDWSSIAGRDVVILPDNDEAGEKFVAKVTTLLHALDPPATVKVVRLKARPPEGGDLADLVADCQGGDDLVGLRQEVEDLAADAETEKITAPKNSSTAEKSSTPSGLRLLVRMFDEIEERKTNWLWKNRIIIGGLTIVTGPGGNTKSTFCIDRAARVSLGQRHPDNSGMCPSGTVLWFGHEDAPNEIMKPRLVASGADCAKIGFVDGVVSTHDGDDPEMAQRLRLEAEIELLRETLQHMTDVKMLVFDPLPEFIGGDHNSAAEVRSALMPLNKLAQEFGIAVVAVYHQNKKQGLSAVQTIAGSGGFTQVARTVLCIINDPDDEDKTATRRRFMVVAKSNYGGMGQAQAYRLASRRNDQMAVDWESLVFDDIDSEDLIKRSRTNEDGRRNTVKRDAAVDDMHRILSGGPLETNDIDDKMAQLGHSRYAIRQARSQLDLVKVPRERNTDPHRWQLPEDQTGTYTFDNWQG